MRWIALPLLFVLAACSGPRDTPLPNDISKMDSIKPALEKLSPEERDLVAGYIMRHTVGAVFGAAFGTKADSIPEGMTIGKAIDEQRGFVADRAIEEAKQKALAEKLKAEREAAMTKMRDAVTVTLVSKRHDIERGYSGMVTDEQITVVVGYKNNTGKDVAGVKGTLDVNDIFGEKLSGFNISNDRTIKAGESMTWTGGRSIKYGLNSHKDQKFASLEDDKYKVVWRPDTIVFADGERLDSSGTHAPSAPIQAQPVTSPPPVSDQGQSFRTLAEENKCFLCHDIEKKVVGPAYRDVSKKYAGKEAAENNLVHKVMNGGVGVWGKIPMPPKGGNPRVTEANARILVKWILTQ